MTGYALEVKGPSPNRTSPRTLPIEFLVVHWWGAPPLYQDAGDHDQVVSYLLTKRDPGSSANGVISGWPLPRVTEIVPTTDIAWQAGNWPVNQVSVGYELHPFDEFTPRDRVEATFETAAAYFALLWHRIPALKDVPFHGHQEYKSTSCPGSWMSLLPALFERTQALYPYVDVQNPGRLLPGYPPLPKEMFMQNPAVGSISSEYGWRAATSVTPAMFHAGIDIANKVGTPIVAAYAGVAEDVGLNIVSGRSGLAVKIRNPDGERQYYGHLSRIDVVKGQTITKGQQIGLMGATGNVTGSHLHFECWAGADPGSHRNPRIDFRAAGITPGVGAPATAAGRDFLPLEEDGIWGHRTITEAERALAAAGFYKGEIEEDLGKTAVDGPLFWTAYQKFLVANDVTDLVPNGRFDGPWASAEQTWLNRVDPAFYPWMPPDGVRGKGAIRGFQMALNRGKVVVVAPPPVVTPPEPVPPPVVEPPVVTPPAAGTPILGPKGGSIGAYQARAREIGASALFVDEMIPALHDAAVIHGIDPAVLIGQSGHETGWGNFGRAVTPEHHNTCGLKIRNPVGPDDNPDDHARFASWFEGATAHAQHLYAYMTKPLPAGEPLVDPRWDWVFPVGHRVQTVEQLGRKWAPSPTYGEAVAAVAARFRDLVEPPLTPPVEPTPEPAPVEPTPTPPPAPDVAEQVAHLILERLRAARWRME